MHKDERKRIMECACYNLMVKSRKVALTFRLAGELQHPPLKILKN